MRATVVAAALFGVVSAAAAAPKKVVLVAGKASHGPGDHEYNAGVILLKKFLAQNGVNSEVVTGGFPADTSVFDGASAIVLFMDGGVNHPAIQGDGLQKLGEYMKKGVGLACLHYAVEVPQEKGGKELLEWIGGYYERPYSTNPFNDASLKQATPKHAISRGWKNFELRDEWYYRMRFTPGDKRVVPILTTMLPKNDPKEEIVAWACHRKDGGRGFGFTGLHIHKNWGNPEFRRLLVNAVLWTAKADVPKGGAKCDLEPGDLEQNLFPHEKH